MKLRLGHFLLSISIILLPIVLFYEVSIKTDQRNDLKSACDQSDIKKSPVAPLISHLKRRLSNIVLPRLKIKNFSWMNRMDFFQSIRQLANGRIPNHDCETRYQNKSIRISDEDRIRLSKSRYYFAINLNDDEKLLPAFLPELLEILKFLNEITGKQEDSLFLSIYDSGSVDLTPHFLESFSLILEKVGVNHRIVSNYSDRYSGKHLIKFLSSVRNKAMEDFFRKPLNFYDYVIFLNEVYFCFEDIIRLLVYNVDIACGMDFTDTGVHPILRDVWIARDIQGERLQWNPPFSTHNETAKRIMNGKPFSVFSCSNGIVAMKASIFYRNIIFREAHSEYQECPASEFSLLCKNVWDIDEHARIVMDPHVRVAYNRFAFHKINQMFWLQSDSALIQTPNIVERNIPFFEKPRKWNCCPIIDSVMDVTLGSCFSQVLEENLSSEPEKTIHL